MKKIIFYTLLIICGLIKSALAHEFVATLTAVQDGDTLSALVNGENTKIRLLDIDCFETRKNDRAKFQQKYYGISFDEIRKKGRQSKQKLKNLLKDHKYIRVKWEKRDSFGRILSKVYLDDLKSAGIIDVNQYMLEKGGCNKYIPKNTRR